MTGDSWTMLDADPFAGPERLEAVPVRGSLVRAGDRVRLMPRGRADVLDIALRGRTAVVTSIEVDLEDAVHIAVIVDDDPGREFGAMRQPGHRFFFAPDDLEPLGLTGEMAP